MRHRSPAQTVYDLGAQQRRIVEWVWDRDGATARDVWAALGEKRGLAYTSILSVMQRLERMGWLRHRREGRSYRYTVAMTRREAETAATRKFVERVFGGDSERALVHYFGMAAAPVTGILSLRALVDRRRAAA